MAVVAGVENDESAFLHVGIDLGDDRIGQRFGGGKHRPIEDRIECDFVLADIDGGGFARLDGGPRFENATEPCRPARLVSSVSRSPLST